MNARILCAVVLICFTLSARAVELYEFEGYFVSDKDGADPATRFAPGKVGERFEGWIIYDAARHFPTPDGDRLYPAPLVSVYLEAESGYTPSMRPCSRSGRTRAIREASSTTT